MMESCTRPSLSVVVNNYNYGRYLHQSLDSALSQLQPCDEIVVVDDGSTDDSLEVLAGYEKNPQVRLLPQANQGQMSAVRNGMAAANGDVLVLLDSDDYFLDGYLERLRELYAGSGDPEFVFVRARPEGGDAGALAAMRRMLDRMELPAGNIGSTRWAAIMSYEFVGSPTSGLSFRQSLGERILQLPASVDTTRRMPEFERRFLGVSTQEARNHGLTADGVIVRTASALGAAKYYDDRPGFVYRIHGSNKFATVPARGRWYVRRQGRRLLVQALVATYGLPQRATAMELVAEIRGRKFGRRLRRRARVRLEYAIAALKCQGGAVERLRAFFVAVGLG